jgi:hypothetical protein
MLSQIEVLDYGPRPMAFDTYQLGPGFEVSNVHLSRGSLSTGYVLNGNTEAS